jgi:hypothetical protein
MGDGIFRSNQPDQAYPFPPRVGVKLPDDRQHPQAAPGEVGEAVQPGAAGTSSGKVGEGETRGTGQHCTLPKGTLTFLKESDILRVITVGILMTSGRNGDSTFVKMIKVFILHGRVHDT